MQQANVIVQLNPGGLESISKAKQSLEAYFFFGGGGDERGRDRCLHFPQVFLLVTQPYSGEL